LPLTAFIIRPFGTKEIPLGDGNTETVNFDEVQKALLNPALLPLRMTATTTDVVISAGNIREDMFHLLMTADLVIADVTYNNPNVFYELGIRHAFRDRATFLIRSNVAPYPFDLQTDRYFEYNHTQLGDEAHKRKVVDGLTKALRATLNSERADSPVFRLLPRMRSEDRSRFISIPRDFREEVNYARKHKLGGNLRLMAAECEGFLWEVEGLREVGRAQFDLNFLGGARETWEEIAHRYPDDVEANMVLSTIYQRANDGTRSEQALARLSPNVVRDVNIAAEVQSLKGRNLKAQWTSHWSSHPNIIPESEENQKKALRSPVLRKAIEAYSSSFRANLNFSYAGLNALSLQIVELSLAAKFPDVWEVIHGGAAEAHSATTERTREVNRLSAALGYSIECETRRLRAEGDADFWTEILEAAFHCVTSNSPARVAQSYLEAVHWAPRYAQGSMARALSLYQALQVTHPGADRHHPPINIQANVEAALKVIDQEESKSKPGNIVLFVGLRVKPSANSPHRKTQSDDKRANGSDKAGREDQKEKPMRFLPESMVGKARQAIAATILAEQEENGSKFLFGMGSMANGSDILFHQACADIKLPTRGYLSLPKDQYVGEYVAPAGPAWVDQFNRLYSARINREATDAEICPDPELNHSINVLGESADLPRWLQGKDGYSIGRRATTWMLHHALVQRYVRNCEVTLIALWDKRRADVDKAEADGIERLIKAAEREGVKVVHIDCGAWEDPRRNGKPEAEVAHRTTPIPLEPAPAAKIKSH
jgi:hypothetical protein